MASIESTSWTRSVGSRISVTRIVFLSANLALWAAVLIGLKLAIA